MPETPIIRTMTRDDVDFAIRLAANEGWNPGLSDAQSFYAADPEGFFISELNGTPIGTISAVRYPGDFGFVGLYIMTREARGKGFGMELWEHAFKHLEGCTVGLDAVTEQEQTYTRSGFSTSYRSARYEGVGGGTKPEGVVPLEDVEFAAIMEYDRQCFPGGREPFMESWLDAPGAVGYGVMDGDTLVGFGVIRPCAKGYKIGPLFADDATIAETLYKALTASINGEKFYLDVIEPNTAAMELTQKYGLEEVFVTVRMYAGDEPAMDKQKIFGVTSFELGVIMRILRFLIIIIVLGMLWDVGWWLGFGVQPYSPWALKQMVNQGNAPIILDVRTPAEFRAFHIPDAINVPYPVSLIELAQKAPDPTDPIVVVCMTGHRSPPVVRELMQGGYTNVVNLTWGMTAWKLFGGETVSGE